MRGVFQLRAALAILFCALLALPAIPMCYTVSAQDDFVVTIGQDKVFTEFNYHNAWLESDPNNPLPWPSPREAYSAGSGAQVSLSASPGQAGVAQAELGVEFAWDPGPYIWEEAQTLPVSVTLVYSYEIGAYWVDETGSSNACLGLPAYPLPWYDTIGYGMGGMGVHANSTTYTYETTVEELQGWGNTIALNIYCHAHSVLEESATNSSYADIVLHSVSVQFDFKIAEFMTSLQYSVDADGQCTYGQGVIATVFHSEGADRIQSFAVTDPAGQELTPSVQDCTSDLDSWTFHWYDHGYSGPPVLGSYTVRATDNEGHIASVVSWPTDHVPSHAPVITSVPNRGYVPTGTPVFSWEPFSSATTGYLVEIVGPPEECKPGDDVVWRIALSPAQTSVTFNCDGTAGVQRLTPWQEYGLIVYAFEDACDGIQCYRDVGQRSIEFSVLELRPGDLLFGYGAKLVPGFWSHVGMYIGSGQIVHSHGRLGADNISGVDIVSLSWWLETYRTWAVYRVVPAGPSVIAGAIAWATAPERLDDLYDKWWLSKDPNGEAWYCSELVWAAYWHASNEQIDIEYHGPRELWEAGITPDEITLDEETLLIYDSRDGTARAGFLVLSDCPVDLELVDPEGLFVGRQLSEVAGAVYGEDDIDGDGDLDDWIGLPEWKQGDYLIRVLPEFGAFPEDTYGLKVEWNEQTLVLAEDIPIGDIPAAGYILRSTVTEVAQIIPATMDIDPNVLALRAPLKYVTAYIELPTGYDVSQIDISSIMLNDVVPALSKPRCIGDRDEDGVPDLMVKFDAKAARTMLSIGDEVEILVSGEIGGIRFEGEDTLRVIDKGVPLTASMMPGSGHLTYVFAGLAGCFAIAAGMFYYFTRRDSLLQ